MVLITFSKVLDELDRITFEDVYVGDIVNTLEDIKEYIETYYDVKDIDKVLEIIKLISYILGNIGSGFKKEIYLKYYKQIRQLILKWRWDSLYINYIDVKNIVESED